MHSESLLITAASVHLPCTILSYGDLSVAFFLVSFGAEVGMGVEGAGVVGAFVSFGAVVGMGVEGASVVGAL